MNRSHGVKGTFTYEIPRDGKKVVLAVAYTISAYDPGCRYLRNGDPGYPPEGGDIEDIEIRDGQGLDWETQLTVDERHLIETACYNNALEQSESAVEAAMKTAYEKLRMPEDY